MTLRWESDRISPRTCAPVFRVKGSAESVHPLLSTVSCGRCGGSSANKTQLGLVFTRERAAPFTTAGFRRWSLVGGSGRFGFPVHPHLLRHASGFKLANDGEIRGPCRIIWATTPSDTVRYTELSATVSRTCGTIDGVADG